MINSTHSDANPDVALYFANPGGQASPSSASSDPVAALHIATPRGRASPTDFTTSRNSPEDSVSSDFVDALHIANPGGRASPTDFATSGNSPERYARWLSCRCASQSLEAELQPQTLRLPFRLCWSCHLLTEKSQLHRKTLRILILSRHCSSVSCLLSIVSSC